MNDTLDNVVDEFLTKWSNNILENDNEFKKDLKLLIQIYSSAKVSNLIEKLGGYRHVEKTLGVDI